jgi:hypothetical protein
MLNVDVDEWDVMFETDDAVEAIFDSHDGRFYPWPCRVYEDNQLVVEVW